MLLLEHFSSPSPFSGTTAQRQLASPCVDEGPFLFEPVLLSAHRHLGHTSSHDQLSSHGLLLGHVALMQSPPYRVQPVYEYEFSLYMNTYYVYVYHTTSILINVTVTCRNFSITYFCACYPSENFL